MVKEKLKTYSIAARGGDKRIKMKIVFINYDEERKKLLRRKRRKSNKKAFFNIFHSSLSANPDTSDDVLAS